jgi:hypothetical protein
MLKITKFSEFNFERLEIHQSHFEGGGCLREVVGEDEGIQKREVGT